MNAIDTFGRLPPGPARQPGAVGVSGDEASLAAAALEGVLLIGTAGAAGGIAATYLASKAGMGKPHPVIGAVTGAVVAVATIAAVVRSGA